MNIYFKSDFRIEERCYSSDSSAPFKFTYSTTSGSTYVASFDGEDYINCSVVDEQTLLVTFTRHALDMGQLCVEREYFNSDSDFRDGIANRVVKESLDVILSSSPFDCTAVETVVLPLYSKGDDGYSPVKGVDYFTEEEIEGFKDAVESRVDLSLDGLATESYVDDKIANIDLSGYVQTTDSRLSDSRPASDVSAWAKADVKPTYTASEVGAADKIAEVVDGALSITIDDNTIYLFTDSIDELSLALSLDWSDSSLAHVKFKSGDVATSVTFGEGIVVSGSIGENSYVEISVMGNVAIINSVAYE